MALAPGDQLGPYTITDSIGKGGMGEVFRAHDARLDRIVAIKQSASQFSDRFEREARAIATLNHPHICSLFDVGEAPDGSSYLVMEFVKGRMPQGPMPVAKALEYAGQILDALEAAHSKGIVHRDLKPENILIAENGVKILDFGIAKLQQSAEAEGGASGSERAEPAALTSAGAMVGTLQYMSPEQIEGQPADARSDIFAFGLVLYELITGQRAFKGDSQASLIASILKDVPKPIRELEPVTPPALERIIATCLEKDPRQRWQSARDVQRALELVDPGQDTGGTKAAGQRGRPWLWPSAAALFAAVAVLMGAMWPPEPAEPEVMRFHIDIPDGYSFGSGNYVRIAPDASKLAFTVQDATGVSSIWLHDFGTGVSSQLPGTEGTGGPFWSPDSEWLAFGVGNEIKRVSASGGLPETVGVSDKSVGSGFVTDDGRIVFGGLPDGPLRIVSVSDGRIRNLTTLDVAAGEGGHSLPSLLPGGEYFLYYKSSTRTGTGMYLRKLDSPPEESEDELVMESQFAPVFVASERKPGGYLLYLREGQLLVAGFDPENVKIAGDAKRVADGVGSGGAHGHFSVSSGGNPGKLVYRQGPGSTVQLTWFDRQGEPMGTVGEPAAYRTVSLSPDDSKAALYRGDTYSSGDVWVMDLDRGVPSRLTNGNRVSVLAQLGSAPVWSPDGELAYWSDGMIQVEPANNAADARPLLTTFGRPQDWSVDGRFLMFDQAPNIAVLDLQGDQDPRILLPGIQGSWVSNGQFSPDGRWLAYVSGESGRNEIYLRRVYETEGGIELGEPNPVTSGGGSMVRWSRNGTELIVRNLRGPLVSFAVDLSGDEPQWGATTELFPAPAVADDNWDVTADGQRFLMGVSVDENTRAPIEVITNWEALLQ